MRWNAKPLVYGCGLALLVFMLAPRGVTLTAFGRTAAFDNPANDDATVDAPKGKREATLPAAPLSWHPPVKVVGRLPEETHSYPSARTSFSCQNRAPPTR